MFDKVLWFSGGDDSTLLLAMLREQGECFDIIQIRDLWTKEQKKRSDELIKKWKLSVFSYAPVEINLIGQGDEITSVWEYVVGGSRIPMLRDITEGTRCIAELQGKRMSYAPMEWVTHYVGSRKEDRHYATGKAIPGKSWTIETAYEKSSLQQLWGETREPNGRILPEVSSRQNAFIPNKGEHHALPGTTDEIQGSPQGRSISGERKIDSSALHHLYERQGGNAPQGLQQSSGCDVDVPPVSFENTSRGDNVKRATFEAPLYEYSKADVHRELKMRGIEPTGATGDLELCTKCLHGKEVLCPLSNTLIPPVAWDAQANMAAFRDSFGIKSSA